MADIRLAKKTADLEAFRCDANYAISFKLVRKEDEIDDPDKAFHPEMTHQIFGDSEMIFGYKGLDISIFFTAARLVPYFNISHAATYADADNYVQPDNLRELLKGDLPPGHQSSLDQFRRDLSAAEETGFKPFGAMIDSYTVDKSNANSRTFEVYYLKIEEPGFRAYHDRMQTFIKFFIDAASYIDVDDDQWDFFLVYEKYMDCGSPRYALSGYMTVYNFYAYPEKVRPRISQVLILPPFQKMGLGARLVQTFYNLCYSRPEVLDITVEDPSENFQRLRDFVDCQNCGKLDSFEPKLLRKGFNPEMVHEAQSKLRISRLQSRRVYEILRLKATDESNKEMYRAYRLDVKRRLNLPFVRNRKTFRKLEKTMQAEELTQTLGVMSNDEQRFAFLEAAFQEDVKAYRKVLDRMEAA